MSDIILISELSDAELDFIGAGGKYGGGGGGHKPSKTVNKYYYNFDIVQSNVNKGDASKGGDISMTNNLTVTF
jgi:hypothetical protein